MKIEAEDIEVVSTYVEDGEINVLIGTREGCPLDIRWQLVLDKETGSFKDLSRWVSTDEGNKAF